jgi:hypothetical protein
MIIVNEAARPEFLYSSVWLRPLHRRVLPFRRSIGYIPRGRNQLNTIFECHFDGFCDIYEERYAATYRMFRLDRIRDIGERFLTCGDYRFGVTRIRCNNPACDDDYLRPISCKGFDLCPTCSQKPTLVFAEHLTKEVLLELPQRQFVFTIPKALRPFFRHDRHLFAEEGAFVSVPFSGLQPMTEVLRCRVIWLLVEKELLSEDFARNLLSWRNSGFSIDNSVQVTDARTQESLAQYISRPPIGFPSSSIGSVMGMGHRVYRATDPTILFTPIFAMAPAADQLIPAE